MFALIVLLVIGLFYGFFSMKIRGKELGRFFVQLMAGLSIVGIIFYVIGVVGLENLFYWGDASTDGANIVNVALLALAGWVSIQTWKTTVGKKSR